MDFKLISADGHINEPPAAWERVQKEYGDRAPKVVKDPEGFKGIWVITDGLPPSPCSNYSIGHVVSKPGGLGSVGVLTNQTSCSWLALSYADWISSTPSGLQSGLGLITYSVNPNLYPAARTGTIWIAGKTLTIDQSAFVCA